MAEMLSALAGKSPLTAVGIAISERPPLAMVQVASFPEDAAAVRAALAAGVGVLPATTANFSASNGRSTVLWLGPDRWLVVEPRDREAATWHAPIAAAGGFLTDLSHSRSVIRIAGAGGRALLAKGVGPDLHPAMFPPGASLQTRVAHTNVLLHAVDDIPSFDLYVPRSFAADLWEWLSESLSPAQSAHS